MEKAILRLIDANLNRVKEGLRVCEDICRFILNDKVNTKKFKRLRHKIFSIFDNDYISFRNIEEDIGKKTIKIEMKRDSVQDIFMANTQRIKESLRVLEEFSKFEDFKNSDEIKKIRYEIYALEKNTFKQF